MTFDDVVPAYALYALYDSYNELYIVANISENGVYTFKWVEDLYELDVDIMFWFNGIDINTIEDAVCGHYIDRDKVLLEIINVLRVIGLDNIWVVPIKINKIENSINVDFALDFKNCDKIYA